MGNLDDSLFIRTLNRQKTERTPIWLLRQAGRYQPEYRAIREKVDFLTLCKSPQLAAQVTTFACDQLETDAAIIFADILLPLEPLGAGLRFAKGDGPVIDHPVVDEASLARLVDFSCDEHLHFVAEAIEIFVRERPRMPLIGFAGAPFTLASYLIEGGSSRSFDKTKTFMYRRPDLFESLMQRLTLITIDYLEMQHKAGAHCLMLFDSWVGALDRYDFVRHVEPHVTKIIAAVNAMRVPSIYFGTATGGMLDLMSATKATCIGVDWRSDLSQAWRMIGHDRAVQGNLEPLTLLADKDVIVDKVQAVLDQSQMRPGHIFNLGHGIMKETDPDKARYLVDLVKELSTRKIEELSRSGQGAR
jgi:uroporphyrinogen decarboxylase